MNTKFFESAAFKKTLISIGILVVLLMVFSAGVFVGYGKARFSSAWGENYERNFGGPPHRGMFGFLPGGEITEAHGTFGSILNVGSSTIVINGRDNIEKTVLVSSSTILRENRDAVKISDLKANDPVVVIGMPTDQGQIAAQFIRVLK